MKNINFNKLHIKNFLSVGEEPVEVRFQAGINVITGINKDKSDRRNGVGKSTIADALYFAIFGNTIRDLKKENISNNITSGTTEVSIDFNILESGDDTNYVITRLLNPSKCYIYINGEDTTRDSITNTSRYISRLLSSTPDVFQNCIILTLNNTIPFMAQKKIEKRRFIEGILNLQVFSDMLSVVKGEYNDYIKELEVECTRYEEASNQLQSYIDQQSEHALSVKNNVQKLQSRQQANTIEIEALREKTSCNITKSISEYKTNIKNNKEYLSKCLEKYEKAVFNISESRAKTGQLRTALDNIGTTDRICPVCLRPVTEHDKEHIEVERKSLEQSIEDSSTGTQKLVDKLTRITDLKQTISLQIRQDEEHANKQLMDIREKDNLKNRINQLEDLNKQSDTDIKEAHKYKDTYIDLIRSSQEKLDNIQKDITAVKSNINRLDIVKFVVSEEGVRSYIVKKILQLLNGKLSYYLQRMDANCVCVFNEYFEEQIIDEKGKICSYHNFSGAERKNIDLACLFAFMDIRRLLGTVSFNFSVYDELLDSSLDERGIELVLDILRERVEKFNECAMIISHRKESMSFATNDIIFLQKENGITTRIKPPTILND